MRYAAAMRVMRMTRQQPMALRRVEEAMKGKGLRQERETIINFNEESDIASIWTASKIVCRRLKKLGYVSLQDNERSAVFEMPKRDIKLPRPRRVMSEARRERIRESLKAKRNGGT
jgi:hypothetical protein